ncbi:MAG: regulatory protein RecX [Flavobacteriaceae bacterium]|nr:regulatory protein RecX [Flavobacteriaceae bacterium]
MRNSKSYTVDEALLLLERYCSYQERCHAEVEQKLFEYGMIKEAKERIILHLMAHNYLNEERFAKSFSRGKFNIKHWGRNKIKAELQLRNISQYNIISGLKEIDEDDYLAILLKEIEKKSNLIRENDSWKHKKKVVDYLIQKGFEFPLIENVWNDIKKDE